MNTASLSSVLPCGCTLHVNTCADCAGVQEAEEFPIVVTAEDHARVVELRRTIEMGQRALTHLRGEIVRRREVKRVEEAKDELLTLEALIELSTQN